MLLSRLSETSQAVGATRARSQKIQYIAALLREAQVDQLATLVSYLSGELPRGRIGVGYAAIRDATTETVAASAASLSLAEVQATFDAIQASGGAGSGRKKQELLARLLARATQPEREFLFGLLSGELRQGAQVGVMQDAVAKAEGLPLELVRRAAMLRGELGVVAVAARNGGAAALSEFRLQLLRPVEPMLAQSAEDAADLFSKLGPAGLEYKLDGARIQVHKDGSEVRAFSRQSNDVSARVPEIIELVQALPARSLVLDGEAIALGKAGAPLPFQVTMRRFGRKLDVERQRQSLPLSGFFFDCLHLDGQDLIDLSTEERGLALEEAAGEYRVPHTRVASEAAAREFLARALADGHEGVMGKSLSARYEAGRRGAGWLKLKPVLTLDLVVLAVEWGSGRRKGYLSNLHLGARDAASGGFVMLGKTFKGMSDELLAWQTKELLAREIGREGNVVLVRPELVVEIALDGLQVSSHYPGGLALRFARVRRYRSDKTADQADTIDTVRSMHAGKLSRGG